MLYLGVFFPISVIFSYSSRKLMLSFFGLFTAFMFTIITQNIHKFFLLCKKLSSINRQTPNCAILTKIVNNIGVEKNISIQRKDL